MDMDNTTISKLFGEQLRSLPVLKRTIYIGGKPVWIQQLHLTPQR